MSKQKKDKIIDKDTNITSDNIQKDQEFLRFKELYFELKQKYGKDFDKFFRLDEKYIIPCSIFSDKLSSFESIIKYLVENCNIKISHTAKLLNRSNKTVWQAYQTASKKHPSKFSKISSKFWIPASTFSNRKLSILENISVYLRLNYNLSFKEIAKIVDRNILTVRTVYYRAMKKGERK